MHKTLVEEMVGTLVYVNTTEGTYKGILECWNEDHIVLRDAMYLIRTDTYGGVIPSYTAGWSRSAYLMAIKAYNVEEVIKYD